MFKPIVCSVLLLAFVTANAVPTIPNNIATQVIVVNDVSQLDTLRERGIQLTPMSSIQQRGQITYYMGSRARNDQLVAQSSNNYTFSTSQDALVRLEYPKEGEGAIITYAEVAIDQSTFNGRASLLSGGVGQRSIVVVIEAYNTLFFNYASKVYGI